MNETMKFLMLQVEALQTENQRLNDELSKIKTVVFETRLSNSTFTSANEIEVTYNTVSK